MLANRAPGMPVTLPCRWNRHEACACDGSIDFAEHVSTRVDCFCSCHALIAEAQEAFEW